MKRDPRLRGLSSEHHHALVLARALGDAVASGLHDPDYAHALATRFDREIAPHFRVEEEVLLPALRAVGELELVERTERDHETLRAHAAEVGRGETGRLGEFAYHLREHVRFEERELFPICEARLPPEVLDEVQRRAPQT